MSEEIIPVAVFVMLAVGALGLFGFLAVASWADARRRERESFYRSETLKKIAELQGSGVNAAVELFREQERAQAKKAREGQRLAGLITIGVGIGLMAFLKGVGDDKPAYLVGLIPALAGVALLTYSYLLAAKD